MNLMAFITELQQIVDRADNERLSVWVEQFRREYPELAEEVSYCAQMDSAKTVLAYLSERNGSFALLKLVPRIEPAIEFLMNFIRERSNDDSSNHPDAGNAVRRTTRPRRAKRASVRS